MEALQYIYTSWKNGSSTEKGYMIYSRSEGISEAECTAIKDAMQYLVPKELTLTPTPQEIENIFPYSFAYFILPTGRGCVAQSTYLGKDYSGRYGNYIIYALIFDIDDLPCRPAELFAEPYIKTAMTEEELNAPSPVPPLPPLQISEYASVINDDQLNEFLMDKEDELAQLISMILSSIDSGIPFYLNDTRENLVLWAASVQRVLPPRLAKKFMFNTYVGNHDAMRSQKAKDEGLNFHLIGVRPDANYFNYAAECRSNRQNVMDFIGGYMTQGIVPTDFAKAMASSITFDGEEVDSFGEFVDSTSFNEINGHLQDAYLCYNLLKNDEFDFTEDNLKAVLAFASEYCSDYDNSDIGGKLLVKCQEGNHTLGLNVLASFWTFVCKHSSFMIYSLFDIFTDTIYQYAGEASEPCVKLNSLLAVVKEKTPQQYREYLDYLNTANSVDNLLLYLSGHSNPHTNSFYINWLLQSYTFADGLSGNQPMVKLMAALLRNVTKINGCEKLIIEILLATADNKTLFEHIMNIFMNALKEPQRLEQLCVKYVELTKSLSERQLNRFEQLLWETPGASPIASRLCARKIAAAENPEDEFWRFYRNRISYIAASPGITMDPMIMACINNVDDKVREDVAADIIRKIDASVLNDSETIRTLTDTVNGCSVKLLVKTDISFLKKVCQIRVKVDKTGLEKIKAVYLGMMLKANSAQEKPSVSLSKDLSETSATLKSLDKSDYEAYIKNYFDEYFVLIQSADDVSALMQIFYNSRHFSSFADDFVSALKKLQKKETERWKRVIGWTCIYLLTAKQSSQAAEELYKPIVRYLRSLDEDELSDVRQAVIQGVPSSVCDSLFDEVRRKEGFSEKLGSIFHKK
ncbi:MAG: hypothetical protein LUG52_09080 [Clostridia bacterium]|nr:hypothetical protein [Clostridia bacterium]